MYDDVKMEMPGPTLSSLVDLFVTYAKQEPYVIFFETFDECGEQGLVKTQLIQKLHSDGIKVFVTYRPHVLQNPKADFQEFHPMVIQARNEDIELHIRAQLDLHENAKRFEETFKEKIINVIILKAKGMYTCP
jgi:hypothetical protein